MALTCDDYYKINFFFHSVIVDVNGKNGVTEKDGKIAEYEQVDAIQEAMGALGRWQVLVCIAISLVKFPVAWHQLAIVFMAPQNQGYNCTSPARTPSKDQCLVSVNGTHMDCEEWEFDRTIFPETIISQVKNEKKKSMILINSLSLSSKKKKT